MSARLLMATRGAPAPPERPPMRRRRAGVRRLAAALALWCCGMTATVSARTAEPGELNEDQVKAAFLYNFAKFVQWPALRPGPIVIGILGEASFGGVVDQVVRGRTAQGRELVVRRLRAETDLDDCHIVFVSAEQSRRMPDLRFYTSTGVLTIGETPHFLREGGLVRFYVEGSRLRFQVNREGVETAGLRISSQLLELAR